MATGPYDILFCGVIQNERDEAEVKRNIGKLFQADEKRLARLFSGKPIMIKSGVDRQTAAKYQATFKKAGAVCRIRQNAAKSVGEGKKPTAAAESSNPASSQTNAAFTIAPVGADVTDPVEEQAHQVPDIHHMSMAEVGADVLENPVEIEVVSVDTSLLSVAELGSDLTEETDEVINETPNTEFLQLDEPGVDILEEKNEEPPAYPDISGISLVD